MDIVSCLCVMIKPPKAILHTQSLRNALYSMLITMQLCLRVYGSFRKFYKIAIAISYIHKTFILCVQFFVTFLKYSKNQNLLILN